jgi:hypothetical protein
MGRAPRNAPTNCALDTTVFSDVFSISRPSSRNARAFFIPPTHCPKRQLLRASTEALVPIPRRSRKHICVWTVLPRSQSISIGRPAHRTVLRGSNEAPRHLSEYVLTGPAGELHVLGTGPTRVWTSASEALPDLFDIGSFDAPVTWESGSRDVDVSPSSTFERFPTAM